MIMKFVDLSALAPANYYPLGGRAGMEIEDTRTLYVQIVGECNHLDKTCSLGARLA